MPGEQLVLQRGVGIPAVAEAAEDHPVVLVQQHGGHLCGAAVFVAVLDEQVPGAAVFPCGLIGVGGGSVQVRGDAGQFPGGIGVIEAVGGGICQLPAAVIDGEGIALAAHIALEAGIVPLNQGFALHHRIPVHRAVDLVQPGVPQPENAAADCQQSQGKEQVVLGQKLKKASPQQIIFQFCIPILSQL